MTPDWLWLQMPENYGDSAAFRCLTLDSFDGDLTVSWFTRQSNKPDIIDTLAHDCPGWLRANWGTGPSVTDDYESSTHCLRSGPAASLPPPIAGFRMGTTAPTIPGMHPWDNDGTSYVCAPHWFCLTLLAFPPLALVLPRLFRRRRPRGHCSNCNYDLRAHLTGAIDPRCPECGTRIALVARPYDPHPQKCHPQYPRLQ